MLIKGKKPHKRKQKNNFRVLNQTLQLSQKSELYINQFRTLEDSHFSQRGLKVDLQC